MRILEFEKDYTKLAGRFFTTLRRANSNIELYETVRCVSPHYDFLAKVITKEILPVQDIVDEAFAKADGDCSRAEMLAFLNKHYGEKEGASLKCACLVLMAGGKTVMQDPDLRMNWIKELDEAMLKKYLTNDAKVVYEHCGLDVFSILWEELHSINLYLSDKPIMDLRREYVRKFYVKTKEGNNSKELAAKLGVSEQFVYLALTDNNGSRPEDPTLFPL